MTSSENCCRADLVLSFIVLSDSRASFKDFFANSGCILPYKFFTSKVNSLDDGLVVGLMATVH